MTVLDYFELSLSHSCLPVGFARGAVRIGAGEVRACWLDVEEVASSADCVMREAVRFAILRADNPLPETSTPCAI